MNKIASTPVDRWGATPIWLGGLFSPEAFVQATRQAVAKANGWSLEQVHLRVSVNDNSTDIKDSFTFEGLKLYSAAWHNGALAIIGDKMSFPLPSTRFTWYRVDPDARVSGSDEANVSVPIYLDATRAVYLFSVKLRRPNDIPVTVWHQRGTCITVWSHADDVA
jgi:dynein heavy chain 1